MLQQLWGQAVYTGRGSTSVRDWDLEASEPILSRHEAGTSASGHVGVPWGCTEEEDTIQIY